MNTARVAALLRELADAIEEPASEPAPTKRTRRPRAPVSSTRPVDEVARQAAKNILRRKGIYVE
jgi:hypothetical protein